MKTGTVESFNAYISDAYPTTLIRAIYVRNYTSLKEILRPFAITPVQWRVLANLQEFDGQNVNALAERSYTDRTNLSRAVATLESDGLVKRRRESRDQRNVLIFLTAAGQIKFNEAVPVVLKDIDFVLNGLSQNEIKTLMDLLNKVKENSFRTRRPTYIENLEAKDV
ncbi:MAG: MarR family winged helix-turn-helix transcriptional regulator [Rhodospirillales bacterium]|jgi:DNA-binding MarR family transcriptional regulator